MFQPRLDKLLGTTRRVQRLVQRVRRHGGRSLLRRLIIITAGIKIMAIIIAFSSHEVSRYLDHGLLSFGLACQICGRVEQVQGKCNYDNQINVGKMVREAAADMGT